eukprot:ANDGO_05524.mRNA.1 hypothetical protein
MSDVYSDDSFESIEESVASAPITPKSVTSAASHRRSAIDLRLVALASSEAHSPGPSTARSRSDRYSPVASARANRQESPLQSPSSSAYRFTGPQQSLATSESATPKPAAAGGQGGSRSADSEVDTTPQAEAQSVLFAPYIDKMIHSQPLRFAHHADSSKFLDKENILAYMHEIRMMDECILDLICEMASADSMTNSDPIDAVVVAKQTSIKNAVLTEDTERRSKYLSRIGSPSLDAPAMVVDVVTNLPMVLSVSFVRLLFVLSERLCSMFGAWHSKDSEMLPRNENSQHVSFGLAERQDRLYLALHLSLLHQCYPMSNHAALFGLLHEEVDFALLCILDYLFDRVVPGKHVWRPRRVDDASYAFHCVAAVSQLNASILRSLRRDDWEDRLAFGNESMKEFQDVNYERVFELVPGSPSAARPSNSSTKKKTVDAVVTALSASIARDFPLVAQAEIEEIVLESASRLLQDEVIAASIQRRARKQVGKIDLQQRQCRPADVSETVLPNAAGVGGSSNSMMPAPNDDRASVASSATDAASALFFDSHAFPPTTSCTDAAFESPAGDLSHSPEPLRKGPVVQPGMDTGDVKRKRNPVKGTSKASFSSALSTVKKTTTPQRLSPTLNMPVMHGSPDGVGWGD